MNCLYCGQEVEESAKYPYPYARIGEKSKKVFSSIQVIRKYECSCGYPSFWEDRLDTSGEWHEQEYKYGMYKLLPNMR